MTSDLVLQIQEIQRNLLTQSEITKISWKDSVSNRFYEKFMEDYKNTTDLYIYGSPPMLCGFGLSDLIKFIEQKRTAMYELVNPSDGTKDFHSNHQIHNDLRERDPWSETKMGPQPGDLNIVDINRIMKKRESSLNEKK